MGRPSKRRGYSRSCRNARRPISKKIAAIREMDSSHSPTRVRKPVRQAGERRGVSPMTLAFSGKALAARSVQRSEGLAGSRDSFKVWACRDISPVRHHSVFEALFKRERLWVSVAFSGPLAPALWGEG